MLVPRLETSAPATTFVRPVVVQNCRVGCAHRSELVGTAHRTPMPSTPEFLAQYNALTRGVGVAALPMRTIVDVTGSDRVQFLQAFCTNDVTRLTPGTGCEAF